MGAALYGLVEELLLQPSGTSRRKEFVLAFQGLDDSHCCFGITLGVGVVKVTYLATLRLCQSCKTLPGNVVGKEPFLCCSRQ